jgi:lipopolysaccharide export LptBFGC system permease protein LptF
MFLSTKAILWPWLGAWLSNIVFFATGLVMLGKIK